MHCHECARDGNERPALAHCRFCLVGLCKEHLVESFRSELVPRYACRHRPELPFPGASLDVRREEVAAR